MVDLHITTSDRDEVLCRLSSVALTIDESISNLIDLVPAGENKQLEIAIWTIARSLMSAGIIADLATIKLDGMPVQTTEEWLRV